MTNTILKQTTSETPLARRRGRPLGSTNAAKKAAMEAAAQEAQSSLPPQDDYQLTPDSLGKTAASIAAQTPPPAEEPAIQRKPAARRAIGFKAAKFNTAPAKSWGPPPQPAPAMSSGEPSVDAQPKNNRGYDNPPPKYNQNKRDNYNKESFSYNNKYKKRYDDGIPKDLDNDEDYLATEESLRTTFRLTT